MVRLKKFHVNLKKKVSKKWTGWYVKGAYIPTTDRNGAPQLQMRGTIAVANGQIMRRKYTVKLELVFGSEAAA